MSFTLKELARASKTSVNAIEHYLADRMIPSPELRGPNTRYTALHLHWLLGMKRLRAEEGLTVRLAGFNR
jgi:DNA-binding transcriptional MerR regulator